MKVMREVECPECGRITRREKSSKAGPCSACKTSGAGFGPIGRVRAAAILRDYRDDIERMRSQQHTLKAMRRSA